MSKLPDRHSPVKTYKVENYNQLGEIVVDPQPTQPYTRTMSAYNQHIIHETKDLFEGSCTYCQDRANKPSFFVCSKCKQDCYTRRNLDDHWLVFYHKNCYSNS